MTSDQPQATPQQEELILARLGDAYFLEASQVEALAQETGLSEEELARVLCLRVALQRSVNPISHYAAGAVLLGASGALYIGANMEFRGTCLGQSVHAEQCAVANALLHRESALKAIVTAPTPCGHCRQFLRECQGAETMQVRCYAKEGDNPLRCNMPLLDILPHSFGPQDLDCTVTLLNHNELQFEWVSPPEAPPSHFQQVFEWLSRSYAPHTGAHGCVALEWEREGKSGVAWGVYMENAAYNPSFPPLQCALVHLKLQGASYEHIVGVQVFEKEEAPINHFRSSELLLSAVAPGVKPMLVNVRVTSTSP